MSRVSRMALVFVLLVALNANAGVTYNAPSVPIPSAYFALHINAPLKSAWPTVPFGAWRMWDTHTTWSDLEPTRGTWNFQTLDKIVALAELHKVDILLPLAGTPQWASARPQEKAAVKAGAASEPFDIGDWRDFVRAVAQRYKGRIHEYEIWNEPNNKNYWTGNVENLVRLTLEANKILKGVDPSNIVVSPSATDLDGPDFLDKFLQAGGGKVVDVIGYHFYVGSGTPEKMVQLISQVKTVLATHNLQIPLWCTEAGWAHPKPFPEELAPGFVSRSYILSWAAGISRFYWYAWDNGNWVTLRLLDPDTQTPLPPATAFATTEKWLLGSTMSSCSSTDSGIWTCGLTRNGKASWIVWKESGQASFTVPSAWSVNQLESVLGDDSAIHPGQQIAIGSSPQLFR